MRDVPPPGNTCQTSGSPGERSARPVEWGVLRRVLGGGLLAAIISACTCGGQLEGPDGAFEDVDAGSGCTPYLVGFMPTPMNPPSAPADACTRAQVEQMYDACFAPSWTPAACQTFQQSASACASCIEGPSTAATWGPIVDEQSYTYLNVAGCIALFTGDSSPSGCAAKLQTASECEGAACANCPVTSDLDADVAELAACIVQADMTDCSTYKTAECDPNAGGFAVCTNTTDFATLYFRLAPMFCSAD
jgi:hypothetical protein